MLFSVEQAFVGREEKRAHLNTLAWEAKGWTAIDRQLVNILVPPKIVNFVQEYKVGVQQSVTLRCQAEGNPEPRFTWSPCSNDCNTGTLTIPEVLNDTVYTCTATNGEGSDSAETSVGKLPLHS